MYKIRLLIGVLVAMGMGACEEQYFFDEDKDGARQIVISGYIHQGRGPYLVKIQQTSFTGQVPTDVYGACVTLFDQNSNSEAFQEVRLEGNVTEDDELVYQGGGNIVKGFPGRSYHIEVELSDGRRYRTEPDRMPLFAGRDQLEWVETEQISTSQQGIDVSIPVVECHLSTTFDRQDEPLFLTWLGEETYAYFQTDFPDPFNSQPPICYTERPIGAEELHLFTNVGYTLNRTEVPGIITRPIDKSFQLKHIFTIYQYSMSERNYQYMKSIEVLAENSGSLFDKPPGVPLGNVVSLEDEGDVQGYFQAVLIDTTRIAVYPSQLRAQVRDDCAYMENTDPDDYAGICKDCTLLPNTSTQRPDYWIRY